MQESEPASRGLWASVRRIMDTLLSTVHNRVELCALELQEEKQWLIATLLWVGSAIFFCGLALLMVTATVIFLCPAEARPYVFGGFCLLYISLAVFSVITLVRQIRDKPPPMAETVSELKKDIAWFRARD